MRILPTDTVAKLRRVREASAAARSRPTQRLDVTSEVADGVRLVLVPAGRVGVVFSLWQQREDVAALSGDCSVPAGTVLLALDGEQARAATAAGRDGGFDELAPSPAVPGLSFMLLFYTGQRQIRRRISRLTTPDSNTAAAA